MKARETCVKCAEFLESFRGRLNQIWSTDWNVGTGVLSVFHAVDEGRDMAGSVAKLKPLTDC